MYNKDEIVEEVRKVREEIFSANNYDLVKAMKDAMDRQNSNNKNSNNTHKLIKAKDEKPKE